jgi:hypothetical protein
MNTVMPMVHSRPCTAEPGSVSSKAEIRAYNERLILASAEKTFAIYGFKGSSTMQTVVLNDGKALSNEAFEAKKYQVIRLILSSVGLLSDSRNQ